MSLTVEAEVTPAELGPAEQLALEKAMAAALTSGVPSERFVAHLGQQLAETARREQLAQQRREERLRTAGLFGLVGGIFSLLGGLAVWLLWRQRRKEGAPASKLLPA